MTVDNTDTPRGACEARLLCAKASCLGPLFARLDVDSVPEETRTPVEWLLAAVRKCTRSMDLARCLEKNVIGDGTPLGII